MKPFKVQLKTLTVDEKWNCRRSYNESTLRRLGNSLKRIQLSPIVVYGSQLVIGFRRVKAGLLTGLEELWAIETDDPMTTRLDNLVENLDREELSMLDEAFAVSNIYTDPLDQFCEYINRPKDWVNLRLAILNLSQRIKGLVHAGRLTEGQVADLVKCANADHREKMATKFTSDVTPVKRKINGIMSRREFDDIMLFAAQQDISDDALRLISVIRRDTSVADWKSWYATQ